MGNERKRHHYEAAVAKAAESGLEVIDGPEAYENQKSRLHISCGRCSTCSFPEITADKLTRGQGCQQLGIQRRAATRRKPAEELQKAVDSHPEGLTLLSDPAEYKNNRTELRFRCANQHEFSAPLTRIQQKSLRNGCPHCATSLGQMVATAFTAKLLGVMPLIEYCAPFLMTDWPSSRKPLRFDAFFAAVTVGDERIDIALEYQGNQHTDPGHYFHRSSVRGRESAVELLRQGDEHKVLACDRRPSTALVLVYEPNQIQPMQSVFDDVQLAVECAIPALSKDPEYQTRLAVLREGHLDDIVSEFRIATTLYARLSAILNAKNIDLISYDPMGRTADCQCRKDGHQWTAKVANLLGGVSVIRPGTGCPKCKGRKTGERKRLPETEVIVRAAAKGWVPMLAPGAYIGRKQKLRWKCANPACGRERDSDLDHLLRNGCCCQRYSTKASGLV
jgi:hypothetical protein